MERRLIKRLLHSKTLAFFVVFIFMLTVKVKVAESTIPNAGLGLFADEFIPKGMLVWQFDEGEDRRISKKEFNILSPEEQAYIRKYAYSKVDSPSITLPVGDAKYVNNSDSPNIYGDNDNVSFAIKDIQPGDEILEDYSVYDDGNW